MNNNKKPVGTCRFCGSPLYKSDVNGYVFDCPECYEDFYFFEQYNDSRLEEMWEEFGDTDRMEIWHWFDEHYSKGVYKLTFKG